ncbi:hypothetical protein GGX14DRAFT_415069 [Mycena pura]|uniref:Ubiquitin-like domain-containing protein n=1 Tax=Mycena pura TaxID=153505 RepID=A0AAD7E4S3_9AGAR|nr:hypothetical protein GGX14DRAFT_415069 [Mycena pura]
MPLVEIRVELPAFSRTIDVRVPDTSSILDVKREIYRVCQGAPRVEGQRIIWRGRPLLDTETVQELWKSPTEPRIVHLAVHPSAWSSAPPEIPQSSLNTSSVPPPHSTFFSPPLTSRSSVHLAPSLALAFVAARHQQALNALEQLEVSHLGPDILAARTAAVQAVERHGWSWPSILDDEFPPTSEGGVKYERVIIEGQSYLRLVESADQPTAIQLHALYVLASTFPILALPTTIPTQTRATASQLLPPNVNVLLQQLGLPAVRNAANANLAANLNIAAPQPRPPVDLPLRPLLLPLFLLFLRTAVLLYFFAPARKPVFGILVVAWMLYEVWRPIREGLRGRNQEQNNRQQQHNRDNNGQQQPRGNAAAQQPAGEVNVNPPADRRQGPVAPRPGVNAANDLDHQVAAVFDGFANFNLQNEEEILRRGEPAEEPGLGSKVFAFFALLFTTLHPAVWNRRRAVLARREGQIRMEANARGAELDENTDDPESRARIERRAQLIAQHELRPRWLREYMDRVVEGGWVDEAD